jgi:hypothetical protein
MVLMHRKDIIERYGIDPGENASVVPKGDPTAAINVVPDDEKIEAPSQETAHAGMVNNLAAGALKSLSSDPIGLYGLSAGLAWWAKEKVKGNSDATFAEGLYKEGGIKQVESHLEQHRQQLRDEHPDWNEEAISDAMSRYAATPEYFEFNTGQMTPALRSSLRLAYDINKSTGVNKTPYQESFTDDTVQTLGGLLTPFGALKVGEVAQKFATKAAMKVTNEAIAQGVGKAARVAGNVLDWTVVPGTNLAPGQIAGNLAGGMVLDEVQRHVTGDPTLLPSGEALLEYRKDVGQVPQDAGLPPQLDVPAQPAPLPIDPNIARNTTVNAGLGTAATVAAGAGLLALGARAALRGRVAPNVPIGEPGIATDIAISRNRVGIGPSEDPSRIGRAVKTVDQQLDIDAPALQQAREQGIEPQIQAELGQYLTPHGQQLTFKNVWENGVLPENGRATPVAENFGIFAGADAEAQRLHDDGITAQNVLNTIERSRLQAVAEANIAQRNLLNNPLDPNVVATAQEANRINRLWQSYDPAIRRYLPDTDEAQLQRMVADARSDPVARALMDNYSEIKETTNRTLYEGGIITRDEMIRRNRDEPLHTGLHEYDPTVKQKYDPTQGRTTRIGEPDIRVRDPLPPMASARLSLEIAARAAANETGKRNAIRSMEASDPTGNLVRVFPANADTNPHHGTPVRFYERGEELVAQFARKDVADALNQAPIDRGWAWNFANTIRLAAQMGYIGLVKGPAQSLTTFMYNAGTGWAAQRAGTSIGFTSQLLRHVAPTSRIVSGIADVVDSINIPERMLAYGITAIDAARLKASYAVGQKMMIQSVTQGGVFGTIARQLPNGPQALAAIGGRLKAYHDSSWMMYWSRWGESGAHPSVFDKDIFSQRYMRDVQRWARGTPHGMRYQWFGLKPLFNAEMAILNHIGALHQMTEVARGVRSGTPLNDARVTVENARISGGNMSAMPGNKVLQGGSALFPFFRISIAAGRYVFHALSSRGAWDSGLVATRMAAIGAAMVASQQQIEGLGLGNWFYEEMNDFERLGKYWMLKGQHWADILQGKKPNLDMENPKNNFYEIPLPWELAPFYGTMMYGMEQFGWLNRGSNRGNTTAEKDLLFNITQATSISSSPAVNAITIPLLGQKFDMSNLAKGRSPLTTIHESRGQLGTLPSGIPSVGAELFRALFGFNADLAINSLDAGIQNYKKTDGLVSATHRAWDEGSNIVKETFPSVPMLWDAVKKHYNFDAMSSENARMRTVAKDLETAYQNTFTGAGAMRGENRKKVVDDQVAEMLAVTHSFFQKGGLPKIQKRINEVNNQIDDLKASKGEKSYEQVEKERLDLIKELKVWYVEQNDIIKSYEEYLRDQYKDRLQAEGLEPNIDNVVKLVKKYSG